MTIRRNFNSSRITLKSLFGLKEAAEDSFEISESGRTSYDAVSVVLTTNFKLRTICHSHSYYFTTDVLHVLYTFECEAYVVEYQDVYDFLTPEQVNKFEEVLLNQATELLELNTEEELEDFEELSREGKLNEVRNYLDDNCMVLETFKDFDEALYDKYLDSIYENVDFSYSIDQAMERMYDDLYVDYEVE